MAFRASPSSRLLVKTLPTSRSPGTATWRLPRSRKGQGQTSATLLCTLSQFLFVIEPEKIFSDGAVGDGGGKLIAA